MAFKTRAICRRVSAHEICKSKYARETERKNKIKKNRIHPYVRTYTYVLRLIENVRSRLCKRGRRILFFFILLVRGNARTVYDEDIRGVLLIFLSAQRLSYEFFYTEELIYINIPTQKEGAITRSFYARAHSPYGISH